MALTGSDFYLDWNADFLLTPSGSIQTAVGWDRIRQRIIRSLITNPAETLPSGRFTPADYVFEPDFGNGLGSLVDQALASDFYGALQRRVTTAVLEDADIDSGVPPNIQFTKINTSTLWIQIGVILLTGQPGMIALSYNTAPAAVPSGLDLVTEGGLAIVDEFGNPIST